MPGLLLLTLISLVLSLLLVPLCRNLALRWNLVDVPDWRKAHRRPIPRVGGVGVMLACVGSCLIMAALPGLNGFSQGFAFTTVKAVAPGAILVFLVGLADDIVGLRPWQKLAGQIVASGLVVYTGIEFRAPGGWGLHPWLIAALSIGWLVACANAVNLIDGLDGLAAGIALLASGATIVAALLNRNLELAVAVAPLAGALLGFLVFNFNPASIFLGDCGSLMLGFLLGCYGLLWSERSATMASMTAPVIALSIPLMDTCIAIARRFLRRRPIFDADRSHIHHRLLARGLTTPRVALVLYLAEGVAGTLALFLCAVRRPWDAAILVIFLGAAILAVNQLGYVEFGAIRRLMRNDTFRRLLNAQIAVQSLEKGLSEAITPEQCWTAIELASKDFGFQYVEMQFAGQSFRSRNGKSASLLCEIRVPISDEDWVEVSPEFGSNSHSTAVVAFVQTIRKALVPANFSPAPEVGKEVRYSTLVAD